MINKRSVLAVSGLMVFVGCTAADAHRTTVTSSGSVVQQPASVAAPPETIPNDSAIRARPIVRALYANRSAAQYLPKMRHLIAIADTTEINAIVLDMKKAT